MIGTRRILRFGAAGAALSSLLLLAMAFVSLPAALEYPGLAALTGQISLSPGELDAYLAGMRLLFTLDGLFLTGWLIAWLGIATLVRSRSTLFGWLTLAFGLAGALFDFAENSLILGALQSLQATGTPSSDWVVVWKAVQHMSYWLPFLAAVFASLGLWSHRPLDRALAFIGTLGVAVGAVGLYFPALSLASNAWFLLWFTVSALLLWRRANEISSPVL